jgi:hypothetical protein
MSPDERPQPSPALPRGPLRQEEGEGAAAPRAPSASGWIKAAALAVGDARAAARQWLRPVSWVLFGVAFLLCPVLRWNFIFRINRPKDFVWSDMYGYVERALRLASPSIVLNRMDTFYPPGNHVLLAPLFRIYGKEKGLVANQWLWWVFAVIAVWAVGALALKLFKHPLPGAIAMAGLLAHWSFTAFTGLFMSENPFSCFMAVSLLVGLLARDTSVSLRGRRVLLYAAAGLLAGIAVAIRPQFLLSVALMGLPLLRRRWPFVELREALALTAMVALPMAGSIALNSHAAGMKMGMSGNAGFNFYQAHCDVVHIETRLGGTVIAFAAPVRIQRMQRYGGDPEKKVIIVGHLVWENAYFFREGMKCIRADGLRHVRRLYESFSDLFATTDPWPPSGAKVAKKSAIANRVYCYALLGLIPGALWLARRRRPERWLLLQLATVLPIALLFVGDPRYRVPYDMFGCLILGGIVAAILGIRKDAKV